MMPGWGFEWGMMFIGLLVMLLFWGGVIVLAFFVIRALTGSPQPRAEGQTTAAQRETPLEILKKRYARGEITREEYLEMRRELEA